jgi:hypothetical protein
VFGKHSARIDTVFVTGHHDVEHARWPRLN